MAGKNMKPIYRTIMIVAGEASGDMHAASLIKALQTLDSSFNFYGVGGQKLRAVGVELIADAKDMAVVGMTEVLFKLPFILTVMKQLVKSLKLKKPDAVILVDYPDFNLAIAKKAHNLGIKVFYYISPQVWAWRKGRIKKIRQYVDKMAVILPFELSIYRKANIDAIFVGHPLLDMLPNIPTKSDARKRIGINEEIHTVSILPGSRIGEVDRLLPICLQAAEIMQRHNNMQFVLPLANTISQDYVENIIKRHNVKISIIVKNIYDVLAASDVAIAVSGTVTLEAALLKIPMVVIYKISWLSYIIGRMLINVKNICLVNIVAGKEIVPELIQRNANPKYIAEHTYELLSNQTKRRNMELELSKIGPKLGTPGAAERAATIVWEMLRPPSVY